jgi:FG-GAP repeat
MAIATSRVNARGYKTIYTVPTGKRAVANAIVHALSAFKMRLGVGVPTADYTAPALVTAPSDSAGDITKRTASGNPSNDSSNAGASVAMSKDGLWAVIGKPNNTGGTYGRFEVWRYTSGAWTYSEEIAPSGATTSWYSSNEVAISADGMYIAVCGSNSTANRVWIYSRSGTTFSQQQVITGVFTGAPETTTSQGIDKLLSFNDAGDMLAIGDPEFTTSTGRVHIYSRVSTTWGLKTIISNPSGLTSTSFGNSLHLSGAGDRIVIGRYYDDVTQSNSGAVVVMTTADGGTTWTTEQTIKSPTVGANFYFGCSVSMDTAGTRIVIGEYNATNTNTGAGKAYIYLRTGTTWALEATFAPQTATSLNVGTSVDISGDGTHALIGAPGSSYSGYAYLYQRSGTTWTLKESLTEVSGASAGNQFGWSVALGNDPRGAIPAIADYTGPTPVTGMTGVTPVTWIIGVPQGDAYGANYGNVQFGSNYTSELAQRTAKAAAINTAIETDVATQFATVQDRLIDQSTVAAKATWERTGLVLDAGESLIVFSDDYTGDANVQIRGFIENI